MAYLSCNLFLYRYVYTPQLGYGYMIIHDHHDQVKKAPQVIGIRTHLRTHMPMYTSGMHAATDKLQSHTFGYVYMPNHIGALTCMPEVYAHIQTDVSLICVSLYICYDYWFRMISKRSVDDLYADSSGKSRELRIDYCTLWGIGHNDGLGWDAWGNKRRQIDCRVYGFR